MARPNRVRVPKLCQRADTGRLYCTDPHTRKPVYFHSQQEYENWRQDFLARAQAVNPQSPSSFFFPPAGTRMTVQRFSTVFLEHARVWYRKDGKPTSQIDGFRAVIARLDKLLGERPIDSIRSNDIESVLTLLVDEGLVRRSINAMLAKIKTMFRWGVRKDYIAGETLGRILAVEPLKKGRTRAKEKPKVGPVDAESVEAVLKKLRPTLKVMVEIQWLAGMRPGEICRLKPAEIDRSREPWEYRPTRYKTEHRHDEEPELHRRIFFGPRVRAILEPLLRNAEPDRPLFRTRRGTPQSPEGYWGNVVRACERAGVPRFSPNQLRHSTATIVRQKFGVEAARVYLGHENLKTTEVYATADDDLARKVAEEIG